MDALSRLLSLYPMRSALDVRCHFGAPWLIDHPASTAGVAPYHLILAGSAWLEQPAGNDLALQAGDIVFFPKGSSHRLYTGDVNRLTPMRQLAGPHAVQALGNDGKGPVSDILCGQFEFDQGRANAILDALPETVLIRTEGRTDFAGLQALMSMLRTESGLLRPGASAVVSQLSSALFALLIRAWLEQATPGSGLFALLADRRLHPALQGMLAAPEKPWSLQDMAQVCNMSRATLARLFRQATGTTPANILLQTRMAQAAALLRQGSLPVGVVSEAVGYQSEAAFNRVFKRHFGVGPGRYRRSPDTSQ